jgi:methionyl aminopeptidase
LNSTAAHFCPEDSDTITIQENDVAKLDVGVCVNGAIGDTAMTIDPSNAHKELVLASKEALDNVLKEIHVGMPIRNIGKIIQETINSHGYSPIKNLGGHGLGIYNIHSEPHIPNYDNGNPNVLEEGMKIAIEPFATDGEGFIKDSSNPTLFLLKHKKPVRLPMMREILTHIEKEYKTLPFTSRWISKKFGTAKTNFVLNKLCQEGMLEMFPPLIERKKGMVSQSEHSILIQEKIIVTTRI